MPKDRNGTHLFLEQEIDNGIYEEAIGGCDVPDAWVREFMDKYDYEKEDVIETSVIFETDSDQYAEADNEEEEDEIESLLLKNRMKKTQGLHKKKYGQSKDPRKLNRLIHTRIFLTSRKQIMQQTIIMNSSGRPSELEETIIDSSMAHLYTTTEESDGNEFLVLRDTEAPPNDAVIRDRGEKPKSKI